MIASLALVLALASTSSTSSETLPAASTAQKLEDLIANGKAEQAVKDGRVAVAAHPNDVPIRLALARALAAQARHVNRLVNVKLSKDDVARGQAELKDTDLSGATLQVTYDPALFDEAMGQLDAAIKIAPYREDLRVFQCFLLTDNGMVDRAYAAIVDTFAHLTRTPVLAKTMTAYGAERAKRGDAEGAVKLLTPVAKAFSNDPAILVDYANVLTRVGKKTEAYAAFDRATELAPKEVLFARKKAVGAMLLRDYKRAQPAFDTAFRLGHDPGDQFASYAAAYGIDPKASTSLMRELGTPSPTTDPAVADLANSFALAGTAGGGSKEAMTLARTLVGQQQYLFAIPVLDRAVKANPKNAEAASLLKGTFKALGCESLAK
jgi:tetratricopeptide (TPR) repeat protein